MTARRRLALARAVLFWERLCPALWPLLALGLGFLVVAAFDLLPALPGWLHAAVLAMLGVAVLAALAAAARELALPTAAEARRRLERDSGLSHRPLEALDDALAVASGDPLAEALWQEHRRRMVLAAAGLRLGLPAAGLVRRDPYGLRVALSLLLFLGVLAAGTDFEPRVLRALHPAWGGAARAAAAGFDLWITPPDYTGMAPIYRGTAVAAAEGAGAGEPIPVPAGSTVLARVHGGGEVPVLALDGKPRQFATLKPGEFSVTAELGAATRIAALQGRAVLGDFPLKLIADQPPTASWTGPARIMPRGTLRLDYAARDDYGVRGLTLEISRAAGDEPAIDIAIAVPPQSREIKASLFEDLTDSPWAGLPVRLTLAARDALDQVGRSAPLELTLPERVFHNPVAKAVAEQRKWLMHDPDQSPAVAETIAGLSLRTDEYHGDTTVFLSLRAAARRLVLDTGHADLPGTLRLLWDAAVRIEDGGLTGAQKGLREAQQALQDALDRNASDAELDRLMRQLQQAIDQYLQTMAAESGEQPSDQAAPGDGQSVTPDDIRKLLDQARQLAQTGARDAAKQALANLQNLLESLKAGRASGGKGETGGQAMQDLARKQSQLLDRSYRASRQGQGQGQGADDANAKQGQAGGQQGETPGDLANSQEGLRKQLGEMMRQLGESGEIPQALGRAERAMRGAADALKRGQPGEAVGQEGEALDQLQQGAREMAEREGKGQQGQGAGGKDPFGRSDMGQVSGDDVKLPAAADLQRSREILDELRRRAGQADRPRQERDYLNRLLQRF